MSAAGMSAAHTNLAPCRQAAALSGRAAAASVSRLITSRVSPTALEAATQQLATLCAREAGTLAESADTLADCAFEAAHALSAASTGSKSFHAVRSTVRSAGLESVGALICCAVLARGEHERGPSRAAAAAVLTETNLEHDLSLAVLEACVEDSASDLKILASLCKKAGVKGSMTLQRVSSERVRRVLLLNDKDAVAAALSLASTLGCWSLLDVEAAVRAAMSHGLWAAAEEVSDSAVLSGVGEAACRALVDEAMAAKSYRQADNFATKFAAFVSKDRLLAARSRHCEETVVKLLKKRQFSLIERIVDRVDEVAQDEQTEIRASTLKLMREANEHAHAARLGRLWAERGFAIEEVAEQGELELADVAIRKATYLQWEDAFLGTPLPEPIAQPSDLRDAVAMLTGVVGFDVEWDDTGNTAALLQLSIAEKAVLVDLPALLSTEEGRLELAELDRLVFAAETVKLVAFGVKQDLAVLRRTGSWLGAVSNVVDLKTEASKAHPTLAKKGLSATAELILGKPLDKAEQCSRWTQRPLSEEQRAYAALDAWVCVAIHDALLKEAGSS